MDNIENLVIVDAEYLSHNTDIENLAQQAEEYIKQYCNVLLSLRPEGVFLGDSAESIETFGILVSNSLSNILSTYGRTEKEGMCSYIERIDEADNMLY